MKLKNFWKEICIFDKYFKAKKESEIIYNLYKKQIDKLVETAAKNYVAEIRYNNSGFDEAKTYYKMAAKNVIYCAMIENPDKSGLWNAMFDCCGYIAKVKIRKNNNLTKPLYELGMSFHYCLAGNWFNMPD